MNQLNDNQTMRSDFGQNAAGQMPPIAMGDNTNPANPPFNSEHDDAWLAEEAALLAESDQDSFETVNDPEDHQLLDFVAPSSRPAVIPLKKNFRILAHRPLPIFDTPSSKAFEVLHARERERKYYALICDTRIPPRVNMIAGLMNSGISGMSCPQDWGVIEWLDGRLYYAIAFEQPGTKRLMRDLGDTFAPFSDKMISRSLLAPAYHMLSELASRGYTHRAIRPTNIFLNGGMENSVVFGECCSKLSAFDQPVAFEPIESALCHPIARGDGGISDDIYALGVCLGILLQGFNPLHGLSNQEIIDKKMTMGSFYTLMGNARVSPMMMEALKGMLSDSHKTRWSLKDLDNWLNGRQAMAHTSLSRPKAARAFQFLGQPYQYLSHLAAALGKNWLQGSEEIMKKPMGIWLKRSANDEEKAEAFEKLIAQSYADESGSNDATLSRICNVLYPEGPIFYKSVAFMPDGLKNLLLITHESNNIHSVIYDVVEKRILGSWIGRQGSLPLQYSNSLEAVNHWKKYLNTQGIGFGIERCLYEANPGMLCLSPLVFRHTVTDIVSLMHVLDLISLDFTDFSKLNLDTHLASFIMASMQNSGISFAKMINLEDVAQQRLGWLGLLSLVQQKKRIGALPHLAAAIYPWLAPILDLYHSRSRQNRIKEELEKAAKSGSLVGMMAVLQNYAEIINDKNGFYRARYEYLTLKIKAEEINLNNQKKMEHNLPIGQQIVAFFAGSTAALFMIAILYKQYAWKFF